MIEDMTVRNLSAANRRSWRPALNHTVDARRFVYGVTPRQAELQERIAHAREPPEQWC